VGAKIGFDCIDIKILIFGTCDRIFVSAYLFMMKVEMLNGINCKLENSEIHKADSSKNVLRTMDQLMCSINGSRKNKA